MESERNEVIFLKHKTEWIFLKHKTEWNREQDNL